ncbi:MAG: V-type ATPase 116kDa subunit family protein, partial [Candidatus Ornithospirochaeta sp.]
IAVVGKPLGNEYQLSPFVLPEKSLGTLEGEALEYEKRVEEIRKIFVSSTAYIPSFSSWMKKEDEEILFDKVNATASDLGDICYITGYLPVSDLDKFRTWSGENGVGYLVEDIADEDNPPTKLKHKGFIRIIQPLFDMLGLVPGYREKDISRYFLVFMTLFFAMIIGDAGYGLLLVAVAAVLNIKSRKCSDMNALIYVFGGATVIWGALTGTWFGSQTIIENVGLLKMLVIPGLTNFPETFGMDATLVQDNMMTLCFSIGTIHLSLACVLCILDKLPKKDLSFLADLGWMINTNLLYLLVLYLVVDAKVPFGLIVGGIILGFVLVCLFSEMAPGKPFLKGMKESLGGFFTNFIDTISCFSNVMSYIRLFAVGLASLAIAQSFNGMAAGMLSGFALPAGVLVLVIGHAVNLVMGFLSIVVHGVRLNIMEFSGQVGVEWSGYKYEPFSKKVAK